MSDSIEGAALGVAWQIVAKRNLPADTTEEKLIDSTTQAAVKLVKAYRTALSVVNLTPDFSDLLRPQPSSGPKSARSE
jgi:hypothetical protein